VTPCSLVKCYHTTRRHMVQDHSFIVHHPANRPISTSVYFITNSLNINLLGYNLKICTVAMFKTGLQTNNILCIIRMNAYISSFNIQYIVSNGALVSTVKNRCKRTFSDCRNATFNYMDRSLINFEDLLPYTVQ
jgi:hypothetical protein